MDLLRSLVASLLAAATVALAPLAFAEEKAPVAYQYAAPPGCPPASTFFGWVNSRAAGRKWLESTAGPLRVNVQISQRGPEYLAQVELQVGDKRTSRSLTSAACDELVQGAAFVALVAIDNAEEPKPPARPAQTATQRPAPPRLVTREWEKSRRLVGTAGAHVVAMSAVGPDVAQGTSAFGSVRLHPSPWSFRAGVEFVSTPVHSDARGKSEFSLMGGYIDVCPFNGAGTGLPPLEGCARLRGGAAHAKGVGFADARSVWKGWVSAGLVGRTRWKLAQGLHLELEGEVLVPLSRPDYYFEPQTSVFDTPRVGGRVGLGAVLALW